MQHGCNTAARLVNQELAGLDPRVRTDVLGTARQLQAATTVTQVPPARPQEPPKRTKGLALPSRDHG